ncbi:FAD-dependent oxidoreductase [Microbacterium sp.]|uniref:FAD-dependent oxidoreductase n=1 Tax=Microbacterium sp. TaxID=51671 RepID=UPI003F9E4979
MPDHDVAIVGAGPVGLLLACLLAQRGIDVAVFEARGAADDRSRAIGIHPPGSATLDAAGVGAQVRAEALALDGGDVICASRTLASLTFTAAQRVLILPQHRTDAFLRARLSQVQDGALHLGCTVTGVWNEDAVARLSFAERPDITASFVVAADGVRSGIRRQLGIAWRERPGSGWYSMADIPDSSDASLGTRAQLHCEREGLVESFPLPGARRRWVAGDPDRVLGDAAAFTHAIERRTGIRLELPGGLKPTVFQARQHLAARLVHGRVVLVGDAAHETSPIGGQGMNIGWMASQHLASAIERSLRAGRVEVEEYERRTLRAAARAQRRSSFYMTMGRPARGPALLLRNTAIRMLGTVPLRGRTADMITMQG